VAKLGYTLSSELPDDPPPPAAGRGGRRTLGRTRPRAGGGLIGTAPVAESVEQFHSEGGEGKPTYGQLHVCWAEDTEAAKELALKQWPNGAIRGSYFLELALPAHFEEAAEVLPSFG
jgi:coenzyme F420-dependent glucose-6-phosphate dehydrogenase